MEENGFSNEDLLGNVVRPQLLRTLKPTSSGRSTPRSSPRLTRVSSSRTPRREGRGSGGGRYQCFRGDRVLYWLLLITLWTYGGFYIQSRWAHGDNIENNASIWRKNDSVEEGFLPEQIQRRDLVSDGNVLDLKNKSGTELNSSLNSSLDDKTDAISPPRIARSKKKGKKSRRGGRSKARGRKKMVEDDRVHEAEVVQEEEIPKTNSSFRMLVGPFGLIEDTILEWSPEKRRGTCDRNELFARLVWSRNFVLVFHELSMTGAPLSMLELGSELLSCGATVHAVILSRRGGLMEELTRRKIKVIDDKGEHSFKAAMKADLVIAGSAVCAQWIEQYVTFFNAGSNQIAWWIMENRREYFDRSMRILNRVKMLVFLSEMQAKQWIDWAKEENIALSTHTALVPLSVNDELAFVAGIPCSLNTPLWNPERMLEKRQMLREAVRQEMGLTDNDMLVVSLGSINAAKGQLLLVESAHLVIEDRHSRIEVGSQRLLKMEHDTSLLSDKFYLRGLPQKRTNINKSLTSNINESISGEKSVNGTDMAASNVSSRGISAQNLKILIGSVGSKSNKVNYVRQILDFLSEHSNLSKAVLWSPTTTRVASLYSAADVYITNSQGLGETFGRVTIEAMAFGLPVLGTDAGGTKEIVDQNITGLLHPAGHPGKKVLAENLRYLLKNPSVRQRMGLRGREKVEKMYLKRHMYKLFFEVLFKCMRIK